MRCRLARDPSLYILPAQHTNPAFYLDQPKLAFRINLGLSLPVPNPNLPIPLDSSHTGRRPSSDIVTPLRGSDLHAGAPLVTTPLRPSIPARSPSSPLPCNPGSRRTAPRHRSPATNGESKVRPWAGSNLPTKSAHSLLRLYPCASM